MTPEEAIQVADEVLLTHFGEALTDIQRMILSESLAGKGYESMEGYSPQHIKNEGKRLWDLLSEALNESVSKRNFKGPLEKRFKLGNVEPKAPQPSNYDERTWVGREELTSELIDKLQADTRVLWLTGLSGIGKTALGECLASQAWQTEPLFHWIYFEILEGSNPSFISVAAELLNKLGERDLDPQERNDPDTVAQKLVQKLKSRSYWIQIDSLERLLHSEQSTEFIDPYWKTFIQRYLTEPDLTSRLIITAQTFPNPLIEFNDRYPNVWTEIRLNGLLRTQPQIDFFRRRGLDVDGSNQSILTRIAQTYEGHPLVLKVISEEIRTRFEGEVVSYWETYKSEFEQVARELQSGHVNETEYDETLNRKVRERIRKTLNQLSSDALDLLCRSAVFQRPVPKKFWLNMIEAWTLNQRKNAYEVLGDRALIEQEGANIRQHNLIRSIAYDLLKSDMSIWESAERQAAYLWLNEYIPPHDASNIESIRGYLEAFNHYCLLKDWEVAKDILLTPLDSFNKVHVLKQLEIWSLYQEGILLCKKLLGKVEPSVDATCLNMLGNYHIWLGNYQKAIENHEASLTIFRDIGDQRGEASALGNLGVVCDMQGQYKQAIEHYHRLQTISQEIKDRQIETRALSNLGLAHRSLGQYEEAIKYHQRALVVAREIVDRWAESVNLCNLGLAYFVLDQCEKAIECHQQSLMIAREIGNCKVEGTALLSLGIAYYGLAQYERALDYCQQSLEISREISDRHGEGSALGNLGHVCHSLEQYEKAINYSQQSLTIAREIGDRYGEGMSLMQLGATQREQSLYTESLENGQAALQILHEIGDRAGEAKVLKDLAVLHKILGRVDLARQYCEEALSLVMELDIPFKAECEMLMTELESEQGDERKENSL